MTPSRSTDLLDENVDLSIAQTSPGRKNPKGRKTLREIFVGREGLSLSVTEIVVAVVISLVVLGGLGAGFGLAMARTQDANVQSELDAVNTAQTIEYAENDGYSTLAQLTEGNPAPLTLALADISDHIGVAVSENGRDYCSVGESTSLFSKSFYITSRSGGVEEYVAADLDTTDEAAALCAAAADSIGGGTTTP